MAQLDSHQPSKIYRGTVDEVFSHRNEIPPGATLELKVFEEAPQAKDSEQNQTSGADAPSEPKLLRGRGMLAGVLSSEKFMRRKHEETLVEDRSIR